MAHIKTYARLKPSKKVYPGYEVEGNTLRIHMMDNKEYIGLDPQQVANRGGLSYEVAFTEIFSPASTQEDVFNVAAKDIIQNFLNGYNGTIFAFGQTGTGKTYTVEGNTLQYSSRGLSTRALSMIYQQLARHLDDHISVYLSYLEIYQEVAYDLLNPTSRPPVPILPFAKNVTVCEGPQESSMLRGLTLHLAANEEIAQMLLLQGQANRKIAETPTNQRSSRSHAVFTVYLQARKHDSKVTLKSKLHLVDLAGSERVSKTGADGQQLTEAKSINLSLHHLESVIIALQSDRVLMTNSLAGDEKSMDDSALTHSRSVVSVASAPSSDGGRPSRFVPYRNSLLTMLLKDSLGGNCLTAMIATISMEPENVGESVSTCRFAQRVARVANNARRNEEIDDKALISKLRRRISCMKHELVSIKSQGDWRSLYSYDDLSLVLSQSDKAECARIMEGFLQGDIIDPVAAGVCDRYRFLECLYQLKQRCRQSQVALAQLLAGLRHKSNGPGLFCAALTGDSHDYNGGQRISAAIQPGQSHMAGFQKPADVTTSEGSMDISDEFFSASDNSAVCMAGTDGYFLERKDPDISPPSEETHSEEMYQNPCMRIKLKARRSFERSMGKPEQEHQAVNKLEKEHQPVKQPEQEHPVGQERIEQLHTGMQYQRLLAKENSFRMKLKVLEQQLLDHQAYIHWLKNNKADPAHVAKELYLERNQMKCQARFQEKLNKLLEKKAKLVYAISEEKQKSPFVRECCRKSHCDGCSPCSLKQRTGGSTQTSPKSGQEKSVLRSKDLTFSVVASLNTCGDFTETSPPLPADQQLLKDTGTSQHTGDLTPTESKEYFGQESQRKIQKMSYNNVDLELRPYPGVSRQHSGQELQHKFSRTPHQCAQRHYRHPAAARQELQQRAQKMSDKNADKEPPKFPWMFIHHSDHQDPIAKQKSEKHHKQRISRHIADLQQRLTSPKISQQAEWELQEWTPQMGKAQASHELQQLTPRVFKQQVSHELQQLTPRVSKQQVSHELQQMDSEIPKQHADQELQHKISPKTQADVEVQQILTSASLEPQQKSPRMRRQCADQQWMQNVRMSRQYLDQAVQQDSQKMPKLLANQEAHSDAENAPSCVGLDAQSRKDQVPEEVIVNGSSEQDQTLPLQFVDNTEGNVSKEESSTEESQSTEKQAKPIEDYMVID